MCACPRCLVRLMDARCSHVVTLMPVPIAAPSVRRKLDKPEAAAIWSGVMLDSMMA